MKNDLDKAIDDYLAGNASREHVELTRDRESERLNSDPLEAFEKKSD
jgi:hypothetical protein